MSAFNAQGIILRRFLLRETSYILVVFTREFGKIKGVLKGVRAPYPQFAGNFEIFTECSLQFYRKKKSNMDLITQCESLDFFLPVRKDIERLTYANYFIELVDNVTAANDPNERLYDSLAGSLRLLGTESSPKRASRIFELKILSALGLTPQVEACVLCGALAQTGAVFSAALGGLVCSECSNRAVEGSMPISLGAVNFMSKIIGCDMEKASRIKVSGQVGRETQEALASFLEYHVGRASRSMSFLQTLERAGLTGNKK
ncbi:MAG: DNA repair protein RecO [Candidatus Omnitrophica bacterium]|nr:DNA repair protein RecO [Candidatus Omnitrophota bacterium]MDD4013129.1 DNA repair protein RecO [Candidatus Omnitrophota bacterium]